ncbi:MAG: large subunit ribosomal protein L15 [Rhodothermales bacterium]|jgi:large subunit ribosomal protein L15
MDLSNLKPAKGSTKSKKRIARGQGSGRGGHTSTKGHKGQNSRSGGGVPTWFEGGQMPLQRRVPKGGFKNRFRVAYAPVNLGRLQELVAAGTLDGSQPITPAVLVSAGVIGKKDLVKILGGGELETALQITGHKFSASARAKIEKAGGSATEVA